MTELSVAVKQVEDRSGGGAGVDTAASASAAAASTSGNSAAAMLGADNADKLYSFLDTQRTALAYLMSTVKKDIKDVQTVTEGLQTMKK